jgi:plastocyanin
MRRRMLLLLLLSALAVAAAACGGDVEGATTGRARVEVEAEDFEFSPTSWTVPAGAQVTLTLDNTANQEHTFTLIQSDEVLTNSSQLADATILHNTAATAGQTVKGSFTAPEAPGEYQVVCSIPGHLDLGMTATLTVSEG